MRIGVVGCGHGALNKIYNSIPPSGLDLLIICGDFQALRNSADLECFHCPPKYKTLGDFHEYYSGKKKAPCLTVFVGGNHEAVNHQWELYHGGFVAPNIFFLGYSGVFEITQKISKTEKDFLLRIGGMSGIYADHDAELGYFEKFPFRNRDMRSLYHTRTFEAFKLSLVYFFVSHDWPRNVVHYGDLKELLERKPFFKTDIKTGKLGNPLSEKLLHKLRPKHWFSAHLHVKFEATARFEDDQSDRNKETKFLALDKCLPKRQYLQVFNYGPKVEGKIKIRMDAEWAAILKQTSSIFPRNSSKFIEPVSFNIPENLIEEFDKKDDFKFKFKPTAEFESASGKKKLKEYENPQTIELCKYLGIENHTSSKYVTSGPPASSNDIEEEAEEPCLCDMQTENPEEIELD